MSPCPKPTQWWRKPNCMTAVGIVWAAAAAASAAGGLCRASSCCSDAALWLVCVYVAASLLEAALRSGKERELMIESSCSRAVLCPKPPALFEFPARLAALFMLPVFLLTIVAGFGNLYVVRDCAVVHTVGTKSVAVGTAAAPPGLCLVPGTATAAPPLRGRREALYFSAVTATTLGYGDFAPNSPSARLLVVLELAAGMLLIAGAFALLVSRFADF